MASQINTFYSYSFIRMPFFFYSIPDETDISKRFCSLKVRSRDTMLIRIPNRLELDTAFQITFHAAVIKQSFRFYLISINVCISTALILDLTFTPFYCRMVVRFNDVKFANNFWQSFFSMYKLKHLISSKCIVWNFTFMYTCNKNIHCTCTTK